MPLPRCHRAKKRARAAAAAAAAGLHGRHDGRAQRNQAQLATDANAGQGRAHPLSVSQCQAPWQRSRVYGLAQLRQTKWWILYTTVTPHYIVEHSEKFPSRWSGIGLYLGLDKDAHTLSV